jgi:hypothetical protein
VLDRFIPSLAKVIQNMYNVDVYLIDPSEAVKDPASFKNYFSTNCTEVMPLFEKMKADETKTNVLIILGIEAFINAFPKEEQKGVKDALADLKNVPNIKAILADAVTKIKLYEFEEFYRNCVQPINAIWIGSGITDQFTIKSSTYNKQTRSQIPIDFGYNIDRGNARFIKVLDFYTKD